MADTTELGGLAGRYAAALYDLAETAGTLDGVAADLRAIQAMIAQSEDFRRLIGSPILTREEQGRAVGAVLDAAGASALVRRFVGVLAQNRRLFALGFIIQAFLARLAERRGEVLAHVTSAQPLSDKQLERVTESLRRLTGGKVVIDVKVDPELLGGLVVRIGSKLIDNSLKTKLMRLQLAMKGVA